MPYTDLSQYNSRTNSLGEYCGPHMASSVFLINHSTYKLILAGSELESADSSTNLIIVSQQPVLNVFDNHWIMSQWDSVHYIAIGHQYECQV